MYRPLFDALLRRALAVPGVIVDLVDGKAVEPDDADPARVYPLVRAQARHPEAHLALEPGLHHHIDGTAVLAYQARRRTAFAVGGLNAAESDRVAVLTRFRQSMCARGLTRQMFFPLKPDEVEDAYNAGFSAVQVGVEAWIDLDAFTLAGKSFAHVRQMRNRAVRRGVIVEEAPVEVWRDKMADLHAAWLKSKRPSWRMKLLIGSPGLDQPFDRRYVVAHQDGELEAFCTVLPGRDGVWGVDVMCRRPHAIPGSMELLLVRVAELLKAEGASRLSLGPCPMAGVGRGAPNRLLKWSFHLLYSSWIGNQIFGFASLHQFKNKFRPRWEPVYFAASPKMGPVALYRGCRMWGLY